MLVATTDEEDNTGIMFFAIKYSFTSGISALNLPSDEYNYDNYSFIKERGQRVDRLKKMSWRYTDVLVYVCSGRGTGPVNGGINDFIMICCECAFLTDTTFNARYVKV